MFCFPYAGSGPSAFSSWIKDLPPEIEICLIQLPGRENRIGESPFSQLLSLVKSLASAFPVQRIPFAFYGHSMGALISFELAREFRRSNQISPIHLFFAAHGAPHFSGKIAHLLANSSDCELIQQLHRAGGVPNWLIENKKLRQKFLSILRADIQVYMSYTYYPETPLNCPISVFGGLKDVWVTKEQLLAWKEHTSRSFSLEMLPANHFFLDLIDSQKLFSRLGKLSKN
ncbi:MAG: thioesterase domain-containing protein [Prochloraceae cyanobacterium]|nr:thioesterase domain-containing protein [Prochloraceae cyanobacterium]